MKYVVAVVMSALVFVWRAFAVTVLWAWFIVPLLALPPLPVAGAAGITAMVALFVPNRAGVVDLKDLPMEKVVGMSITAAQFPAVALIVGWVAKLFV